MKKMDAKQIEALRELHEMYGETVVKLESKLAEYNADLNAKSTCLTSHNWVFVVERTGGFLGDAKELIWVYMKGEYKHVSAISPSLCGVPHYQRETVTAKNINAIQRDIDKYTQKNEMVGTFTVKAISAREFKINQREETERHLKNAKEIMAKSGEKLKEL